MSDLIDDRVREAFVVFRDDIQVEIQPPGIDAARTTVTRRRRIRTGIVAVGLVAVLIAGFAIVDRGRYGPAPAEVGPTPPSPLDQAELTELVGRAFLAADVTYFAIGHDDPGQWWGEALDIPLSHTFGADAFGLLPAGEYLLRAACAGQGRMAFSWQAGTATGELVVPCASEGSSSAGRVTLSAPGEIRFTAQGDEQATTRAGFVVIITDPYSAAARAMLGASADHVVGFTMGGFAQADNAAATYYPSAAGRFRLIVACVGTATLRVVFASPDDEISQELTCTSAGTSIELELATAGELAVTIELGRGQIGDGGYAYRVERVS